MNITKHPPDISTMYRTNQQTIESAMRLGDQRMKRGDRSTPNGRWNRSVGPWLLALTGLVIAFVALGYFFGA